MINRKILLKFLVLLSLVCIVPKTFAQDRVEELLKERNMEELVKLGEEGVQPLIIILNSDISYDRAKAAEGLGKLKSKRAVEALINRLNDSSALVKKNVITALESITDKKFGEDIEKWIFWLEDERASQAAPPGPRQDPKPILRPNPKPVNPKDIMPQAQDDE